MPKYGTESTQILKRADTRLQYIFNELIHHYDVKLLCSYRDKVGQDKAFFVDHTSKLVWPHSKHNVLPSLAVDVVPWFVAEPHIRYKDKTAFAYMAGHIMMIAANADIKVRWGADFDMDTILDDWDWGHFELVT